MYQWWLSVVLVIPCISVVYPAPTKQSLSIDILTECGGNREGCNINCKSSLLIDGREMARQEKGLVLNIVTVNMLDGSLNNFSLTSDDQSSQVSLSNFRTFLNAIVTESLVLVLSQGCLLLLPAVKEYVTGVVPEMVKFKELYRVNVIVACKGECANLMSVGNVTLGAYTSDEKKYQRSILLLLSENDESSKQKSETTALIVVLVCSAVVVCAIFLAIYCYYKISGEGETPLNAAEQHTLTKSQQDLQL